MSNIRRIAFFINILMLGAIIVIGLTNPAYPPLVWMFPAVCLIQLIIIVLLGRNIYSSNSLNAKVNPAKLRIFEDVPVPLAILDFHDLKIVNVNKAFVKLFELKDKNEAMGRKFDQLNIVFSEIQRNDIEKYLSGEQIDLTLDVHFMTFKNQQRFVCLCLNAVEIGGSKFLIGVVVDNTLRRATEEQVVKINKELELQVLEKSQMVQELKENEEKFQKAFQGNAAGIAITRISDSKYLEVNDAFTTMTGYSRAELLGHSSVELGIIVNVAGREKVLEQVRTSGFARNFETTITNRDGKIIELLSSVETVEMNKEIYAINISYDITDRKKAEKELENLNKELTAFSYTVSHDLRAPLRSIDGYAQILSEDFQDVLGEQGGVLLAKITKGVSRMSLLITSLLEFSQLGKSEIVKTAVNLNQLVNNVLADIDRTIQHKAQISVASLPEVNVDYDLLFQVLFNLISNAIKYSSKKPNPIVTVTSYEDGNDVIISVVDNGAGFDMNHASQLFGVFQRLHRQNEFEGTGVGLAIVERIVSKHGGKIWAESKVNEGAKFSFSLPK